MSLFEAVIMGKGATGGTKMRAPIEAPFADKAQNVAGHILRGYAVQHDNFDVEVFVRERVGDTWHLIARAIVIKDGGRERGPWLTSRTMTPERKQQLRDERKANAKPINRVVWTKL